MGRGQATLVVAGSASQDRVDIHSVHCKESIKYVVYHNELIVSH